MSARLATVLLLAALPASAAPPPASAPPGRLRPGEVVVRAIARGDRHAFVVAARAGEAVVVQASARGASPDLTVVAAAAGGAPPPPLEAEVRSGYPAVTLAWRMEADGEATIGVACPGGRRGRYRLEVAVRPPTPADLRRLQVQEALREGRSAHGAGRSQAAVESFRRATDLTAGVSDTGVEFEALAGLAAAQDRLGDASARRTYDVLIEKTRGAGPFEGEALYRRASMHLGRGEFEPALPLLQRALGLARTGQHRMVEAYVLAGLGEFYNDVGDDLKALAYRRQALALVEREGRLSDEAALLQRIGISLVHFGDLHRSPVEYRSALALQRRALDLFVALGSRSGQAATLHHIGLAWRKLGRPREALAHFQRALALKERGSSRNSIAQTLMGLSVTYEALGDMDRAVEHGRRAQALLATAPSLLAIHWRAPATVARMERDRGNLEEARRLIEAAVAVVEAAGAPLASDGLRSSFSMVADEVYDLYADILMRLHEASPGAGLDRQALEAAERGRARSLRELLREGRVSVPHALDDRLLDDERRLRARIREAAEKQRAGGGDAALELDLRSLTTEHDALRARIRSEEPRYAALAQDRPIDAGELERLVDPGTALLEYSLGRPRSYLWVVTSEGVSSHVLPAEDAIEPLARKLHALLSTRNRVSPGATAAARRRRLARADAEVEEVAARLGGLLLGPAAGLGRYRRLIVVPDGVLHYVPFAALRAPQGGEGPLVAAHEVLHLPSAAVAAALRQGAPRAPAARSAAVFADPVFEAGDPRVRAPGPPARRAAATAPAGRAATPRFMAGLTRLRYTRTLAADVAQGAGQALVAVDFEASRDAVLGQPLDQYRMVVFATHGVLDSEYPQLSGVALSMVDEAGRSRDGFLRLQDVYQMKLNAELVVLGACETGLGREVRGEGLIGLSRGFFHAGASRVLASLWKVDEQATVELIRELYLAVERDGLSYPAALRRAQARLRERPRFRSPYYWAAFVLQGAG